MTLHESTLLMLVEKAKPGSFLVGDPATAVVVRVPLTPTALGHAHSLATRLCAAVGVTLARNLPPLVRISGDLACSSCLLELVGKALDLHAVGTGVALHSHDRALATSVGSLAIVCLLAALGLSAFRVAAEVSAPAGLAHAVSTSGLALRGLALGRLPALGRVAAEVGAPAGLAHAVSTSGLALRGLALGRGFSLVRIRLAKDFPTSRTLGGNLHGGVFAPTHSLLFRDCCLPTLGRVAAEVGAATRFAHAVSSPKSLFPLGGCLFLHGLPLGWGFLCNGLLRFSRSALSIGSSHCRWTDTLTSCSIRLEESLVPSRHDLPTDWSPGYRMNNALPPVTDSGFALDARLDLLALLQETANTGTQNAPFGPFLAIGNGHLLTPDATLASAGMYIDIPSRDGVALHRGLVSTWLSIGVSLANNLSASLFGRDSYDPSSPCEFLCHLLCLPRGIAGLEPLPLGFTLHGFLCAP